MTNTKMITKFVTRGRKFYIVYSKDDKCYLAIEDKYIDDKGCTKQKLNGLQMHANRELDGCIRSIETCCELDYLVSTGLTLEEAMKQYLANIM